MKEPSGTAADGSAVYIPLLQRCRASIACQAARFPQADLPPLKVQLGVRLTTAWLIAEESDCTPGRMVRYKHRCCWRLFCSCSQDATPRRSAPAATEQR